MSTNGSIYLLNDGSAESEQGRLNRQHRLFDDIMQNDLLPPQVASSLDASSTPPKIVEIATGSAIWLLDIAKTFSPDAELVGIDFDTSKFPSASDLPPNITLRQANMFEPFPNDLVGKFDVVNVRLIVFALKEGYGIDLVRNLMTLLKPGGYIVWTETGPCLTSLEPPSQAWLKYQDVDFRFAKKVGRDTNIPISMQYYLMQAGCVECHDKAYPSSKQLFTDKKKDWTPRMNLQIRTLTAQALTGIVKLGGVEGMATEEEAAELIALCQEEFVDRKVHMVVTRAWGRKPEVS
ncbi:S-adenosyl-L-methionine-dependent methyltransferase [Xylaria flabelliformis]|nr:S-adenosyl-L-methionine-dependent methyltransferase [Xylaria flabelliformis]